MNRANLDQKIFIAKKNDLNPAIAGLLLLLLLFLVYKNHCMSS